MQLSEKRTADDYDWRSDDPLRVWWLMRRVHFGGAGRYRREGAKRHGRQARQNEEALTPETGNWRLGGITNGE